MFSADSIGDDIIRRLRERSQRLDIRKLEESGGTVVRFPLLERNQYFFEVFLTSENEEYCAFRLHAMYATPDGRAPEIVWTRGEDEIWQRSYIHDVPRLVDEIYSMLIHRSKILIKRGIVFYSSVLALEFDGRWEAVRLGRWVFSKRSGFFLNMSASFWKLTWLLRIPGLWRVYRAEPVIEA